MRISPREPTKNNSSSIIRRKIQQIAQFNINTLLLIVNIIQNMDRNSEFAIIYEIEW